MALGGSLMVGLGVCGGVMGTGDGGALGGVLVLLCRSGALRAGAQGYADPWERGHRLPFGVGLGSAGAAVAGHLMDAGRDQGLVGGQGCCWLALAVIHPGQSRSVGLGCGFRVVVG